MYTKNDDVVELTAANFQSKVINSDEVWIVEFYAPWYALFLDFWYFFVKLNIFLY